MKKKFVFLKFHVFEDHKHAGSVDSKDFFTNPVMLKTDRFLERELRRTMQLGNKRPYTLVVNTAGCNKNCWFCYAYPILKKKDYYKCKTISLSPEELAECFVSKLYSLDRVKLKDKFLSKLRITGGEPLFSTSDTLFNTAGVSYPLETIDYFLEFFESFDQSIPKLRNEKVIFLSPPRRYSSDIPFPTFLSYNNRIEIRFDTNGFLFRDRGFAERFVGGIHSLFEANKMNNLLIRIDYSLKGVYPLEVYWSQRECLPVDEKRISDFEAEEHPQYLGLKNIFDLMQEYCKKTPDFCRCFDITVEPGISNVKRNSMYYVGSMNWKLLERKLKVKLGNTFILSDVDNKMEVRGKIHTHLKRGVAVQVIHGGGRCICLPTDPKSKKQKLLNLIKELRRKGAKFDIVYIPYKKESDRECRQLQLEL